MLARLKPVALALAFAILVLPCASALADGVQTGGVRGKVSDASGAALPGAKIVAKHVESGFTRDTFSGSDGVYSIQLLPPGDYAVTFALSGFQTVSTRAAVFVDRNTQFDAKMSLSTVTETVEVAAELPVVDKTQTTSGTTVNASFTQKLAVGRSYQSLLQISPGVTGGANPNVKGALSSNNLYLFDGVDTTDTVTGTFGQNFNYEAIQEVAINTGSYSADLGRATGAIVQVVTKSGTNQFHGSAKGIFTNDNWDAQNKTRNEQTGASLARTKYDALQKRWAFTLGGPVLKDNLWFFGSYEKADTTTPQRQTLGGENYQQVTKAQLWSGKISFQASPSHSFEVAGNGDPIDGFIVDYWGATADTSGLTGQDQGGKVWRGSWTGVLSPNLALEAVGATATSRIDVRTNNTNATAPFYRFGTANRSLERTAPHYDLSEEWYVNGATFDGFVDRPRTQFNLAANLYKKLGSSNHNFKAGVDYQRLESTASFAYPADVVYYDDAFNLTTREISPNWREVFDPVVLSTSKGNVWGIYALDKIDFGRLFLNVGFRVDFQDGSSDLGRTTFDATVVSPRIYFKYDISGDGKTLASGGYGRFYQSITQGFSDNFAGVPQQTNKTVQVYDPATGTYVFDSRVVAGGNDAPVNGSLKPSYTDDITFAFERQIGRYLGVVVRGNWRQWNDLIDGVKTITNGVSTTNYENYDPASRKYKGLEIVLDKRFANNWQVAASYTLSRAEGNHFSDTDTSLGDYLTQPARGATVGAGGVPNPPISTGKDINEQNRYGLAPFDRTHDFKLYGLYQVTLGRVTIGGAPTVGYRSGFPYQRQATGFVTGPGNSGYFVTPRGSDRFPSQFYMDFGLTADFKVFKEIGVGIKAESFNITDNQVKISGQTTNNSNYGLGIARNQYAAQRTFRLTALITF